MRCFKNFRKIFRICYKLSRRDFSATADPPVVDRTKGPRVRGQISRGGKNKKTRRISNIQQGISNIQGDGMIRKCLWRGTVASGGSVCTKRDGGMGASDMSGVALSEARCHRVANSVSRLVGIRKSKVSLGRMRVRRAKRYTFVCARSGNPQTAQDRRRLFRTEFATLSERNINNLGCHAACGAPRHLLTQVSDVASVVTRRA